MHDHMYLLQGDEYVFLANNRPRMEIRVKAPDENGDGGGEVTKGKTEGYDFKDDFELVRSEIDVVVDKWKGLPDTSSLAANTTECKDLMLELGVRYVFQKDPILGGSGEATKTLQNALNNSAGLKGETMINYKEKFLYNVGPVMDGLAVAYLIAADALDREKKVIDGVKSNIANAIDQARKNFGRIAAAGPTKGEIKFATEVFGSVIKAASVFAPGEVLVDIMKDVGFPLLDSAIDNNSELDKKEKYPINYKQCLHDFEALLEEYNKDFIASEEAINKMLDESRERVHSREDKFKTTLMALHVKDVDNKGLTDPSASEMRVADYDESKHIAEKTFPTLLVSFTERQKGLLD